MKDQAAIMNQLKALEGKTGRGIISQLVTEETLGYMEKLNRDGVPYAAVAEKLSASTGETVKPMQVMFAIQQYRKRHNMEPVRSSSGKPRGRKPQTPPVPQTPQA